MPAVVAYRESVALDGIAGVLLRQTVAQHLERLAAVACARDDQLAVDRQAAFPQSLKPKPGKVMVISWIICRSRRDRDRVNRQAMSDPRLENLMEPEALPFDGKHVFRRQLQAHDRDAGAAKR